ncbi:hypothetical protein [Novosphingobium album (ex Liu et al. 2023)]|uniref:Uncharacterized protein n=1 Tax=Novosphingobium album (ex Liu et al. 2023) TaxID=3031130 RepID=A0ABT5WVE0_9SPHN|nr:hypothetical protein [Novosphingobium album (ex Liu et al. 2023)]MDE8653848.1 hypothetical protein [Novosphingobium album (ex Liu et al. 2023)]
MAWDAKDIAALKARIPEDHRPPQEAAGLLGERFSSVDSRSESTALQGSALERFNLGMAFAQSANLDAASPSFLLSGSAAAARDAHVQAIAHREAEKDRSHIIQQIIEQIEARNRELADNLKRLAELDDQEAALEKHLARLREGEAPELDAQGSLRDKKAEAAIREYEQRYGVTVDRADAAQIAVILQGIRDEQLCIRRKNSDLIAENEADRQLAVYMGADPKSIPATVTVLEQSAEGQRSVDKATAEMTNDADRMLVADTITAKDSHSRAYARRAVRGDDAVFTGKEIAASDPSDIAKLKLPTLSDAKEERSREQSFAADVPK